MQTKPLFLIRTGWTLAALLPFLLLAVHAVAGTWTYRADGDDGTITHDGTAWVLGVSQSGQGLTVTNICAEPQAPSALPLGDAVADGWRIVGIGETVFDWNKVLTSVSFPDSLTDIGNRAFARCHALADVTFGGGTFSIGDYAFDWCIALTNATLPDGVTRVGERAFYECTNLTAVSIGTGVTNIGDQAFAACDLLPAIAVSAGNAAYRDIDGVLYDKAGTMLLKIPEGKSGAFDLPASVREISRRAFEGCGRITDIRAAPDSAAYSSAAGVLLSKDSTALLRCPKGKAGHLAIPAGVTGICERAFNDCAKLTGVTFPEGVTAIGNNAFANCAGLRDALAFPSTLTSIGRGAFYKCAGLSGAPIFPAGLAEIGEVAFLYCAGLTGDVVFPAGIANVSSNVFQECKGLESVVFPEGITHISDGALAGCSGLKRVALPRSLKSIGANAFSACRSLASIEIPDSVTDIGDAAFINCHSLTSIEIPDRVTDIGGKAFFRCNSITNAVLGAGVTNIGAQAFNCYQLTNVTISAANTAFTNISGMVFDRAVSKLLLITAGVVGDIVLPESVTAIADAQSLGNCNGLTSLTLGSRLTAIPEQAFLNSSRQLTAFRVAADNPVFLSRDGVLYDRTGTILLRYPKKKAGAAIPADVTAIASRAFVGCSGVTTLTVPDSVTRIGDSAFWSCPELTEVTLPANVTRLHHGTFNNCGKLVRVVFGGDCPVDTHTLYTFSPSVTSYVHRANAASWSAQLSEGSLADGTGVWSDRPIRLLPTP